MYTNIDTIMNPKSNRCRDDEITVDRALSSAELWSFLQQSELRRDESCSTSIAQLKDERNYTQDITEAGDKNNRRQFQDMPMPRDDSVLSNFLDVPPPSFKSALSTTFSLSGWSANFSTRLDRVPASIEVLHHPYMNRHLTASRLASEDHTPVPLHDSSPSHGQDHGNDHRPTIEEVAEFADKSHFEDGVEHSRNVIIDRTSNRSFIYTKDMQERMLPEILFVDVPDSPHVARICGQWMADRLAQELQDAIGRTGTNSTRGNATKTIQQRLYRSTFEVKNVFIPDPQNGTVQSIDIRFCLRFLRPTGKLYNSMRLNYFGNHRCSEGILVAIPFMEGGSPAYKFWGSSLPDVPTDRNGDVTNNALDLWCRKIAELQGPYYGKSPEEHTDTAAEVWINLSPSPIKARKFSPIKKPTHIGETRINLPPSPIKARKVAPIKKPTPNKKKLNASKGVNSAKDKHVKRPAVANKGTPKRTKTVKASTIAVSGVQQRATTPDTVETSKAANKQQDSAKHRAGSKSVKAVPVAKKTTSSPKVVKTEVVAKAKTKVVAKAKTKSIKKVSPKKESVMVRLEKLKELYKKGKMVRAPPTGKGIA